MGSQTGAGMHKTQRIATYLALALSVIATIVALAAYFHTPSVVYKNTTRIVYSNSSGASLHGYNITGALLVPATSLPDAPVITENQTFGKRLTNINAPFNATELAVINNAPNAYFETAGNMLLNGSIKNQVGAQPNKVPPFIVNGKPSVIYLGSITCVFCGENRWAMALALSRFGSFSQLYHGYSSFGDYDLPTIYWAPAHYNSSSMVFGSFYNSSVINFIALEDSNPITQGFSLNPISTMQKRVNATGNAVYTDAFSFIIQLSNYTKTAFSGTPYTIWGDYQIGGADAVDFGNTTPSSGTLPLTYMTHRQVLSQFANPNDQFAWSEYAGADLYVAMICSSINNSSQVCSLPAIQQLEKLGY